MDWQTELIASVAGIFGAYLLVGILVGILWQRLDRE
jgi:hypothetical protein